MCFHLPLPVYPLSLTLSNSESTCDTLYLGLDGEQFESQLRMAAALHSLAIPMFHLLHHKSETRALAFTCLGLYHAALALA